MGQGGVDSNTRGDTSNKQQRCALWMGTPRKHSGGGGGRGKKTVGNGPAP
jgi:hypothetical protein